MWSEKSQALKVTYLRGKYKDFYNLCWSIIPFQSSNMTLSIRFGNLEQSVCRTSVPCLYIKTQITHRFIFWSQFTNPYKTKTLEFSKTMSPIPIFVTATQLCGLANGCDWLSSTAAITIDWFLHDVMVFFYFKPSLTWKYLCTLRIR